MDEWTCAGEIRRYQYANVETNRSQNKNDQHQQDSSNNATQHLIGPVLMSTFLD